MGTLRELEQRVASIEKQIRPQTRTGVVGVAYDWKNPRKPFKVWIMRDRKVKHLGYFETLDEATRVRRAAEAKVS